MRKVVTKRAFLFGTASTLLLAGSAAAIRLEDNAVIEGRYFAACEAPNAHEQMIRDLIARLECNDEVTPEVYAAAVARIKATNCPTCGCQLSAIDPYPARF